MEEEYESEDPINRELARLKKDRQNGTINGIPIYFGLIIAALYFWL